MATPLKDSFGPGPKVFKMREVDLAPAERLTVSKVVALHQQTTRTHHPGIHRVELLINGTSHPAGSFGLT